VGRRTKKVSKKITGDGLCEFCGVGEDLSPKNEVKLTFVQRKRYKKQSLSSCCYFGKKCVSVLLCGLFGVMIDSRSPPFFDGVGCLAPERFLMGSLLTATAHSPTHTTRINAESRTKRHQLLPWVVLRPACRARLYRLKSATSRAHVVKKHLAAVRTRKHLSLFCLGTRIYITLLVKSLLHTELLPTTQTLSSPTLKTTTSSWNVL
jgi:hypothetical protein